MRLIIAHVEEVLSYSTIWSRQLCIRQLMPDLAILLIWSNALNGMSPCMIGVLRLEEKVRILRTKPGQQIKTNCTLDSIVATCIALCYMQDRRLTP